MRKQISNIIQSSLVAMLLVGGMVSCEVIAEEDRYIPIDMAQSNRKTLLVDFSGLRCVNCPKAAEEAHHMQELYGDKLVVVEMHPKSNPLTEAKAEWDYTCEEADIYYKHFGGTSSTPLPAGVVNMTQTDGNYFLAYSLWNAAYQRSASKISHIFMYHNTSYNAEQGTLELRAEITNLSTATLEVEYVAWLTEDSIIGPQMMADGTLNQTYSHNHVLRDALTDVWGEKMVIERDQTEVVAITYTMPEKVNPDNCNIVGLVIQNGEVIQASEYKLKEQI